MTSPTSNASSKKMPSSKEHLAPVLTPSSQKQPPPLLQQPLLLLLTQHLQLKPRPQHQLLLTLLLKDLSIKSKQALKLPRL
jgi:hypothetical protein